MSSLNPDHVMDLLADAMELPVGQRQTFLDSSCAGNEALRCELEALLECANPAVKAFDAASEYIAQPEPQHIGPYQLIEPIGEGGMAIVYKAQQHHPVKRLVAIKLIKLGMDTHQFVARFESERQALAIMDHPSVARVYDAGSTDTGRPYFVMEFVPGRRIVAWCDEHMLTVRQRLELFIRVCEAVEHAHRKGIIHRDLKDSNVLVTDVDGRALPKVIDFGVAKAIHQPLTDRTMFTEHGQVIGTPEYMSPEQAEHGSIDIDTRSDVFSLGVLLYELLAGVQPLSSKDLCSGSYERIQRIIRETEPPRPSTRLSTLGGADATAIAQRRQTDLRALIRSLRKELEWIPLKAMRKDREQRYRSAAELADDIGNYLDGRPLIAGPESSRYKFGKFVRRHRAGVTTAVIIALMLIVGILGISLQTIRARRAEARALTERDNAEAMLEFLTDDVLAGATPERIPDAKVREQLVNAMITPAAERVGETFKDRPIVEASVRETMRNVLVQVGRRDLALPHAEAALSIRQRVLGEDHPDTLTSLNNYASVLEKLGRLIEAEDLYKQSLERRRRKFGQEDPKTLVALNNYAHVLASLSRFAEAEPLHNQTLEARRRVLGEDDLNTIMSVNNYASVLRSLGRAAEAEPLYKQALDDYRRLLGDDHPQTITAMNNLASVLRSLGRLDEATEAYRTTLERCRHVLGEEHPDTMFYMDQYAVVLTQIGRAIEAEPLSKDALERRRRVLGEDHPLTIRSLNNYAYVLRALGRNTEAESLVRQAVAKAAAHESFGPGHPQTKLFATNHANALDALGRHAEATAVRRKFGLSSPTTVPATRQAPQRSRRQPRTVTCHPRVRRRRIRPYRRSDSVFTRNC